MNKAILLGRLTRDPELRTTSNNIPVCSFTVAVDRRFKNAQGDRETDFIPVVCWRNTAEFVARYFRQGHRISLVGTIQVSSWDDEQGNRRYKTEVVADEVYFVETKAEADSYSQGQGYSAPKASQNTAAKIPEGDGFLPVEDDDDAFLPFDL